MSQHADTANPPFRFTRIDQARGFAVLCMFAYHIAWDATDLGLYRVPLFTSPFWLGLRAFIPGLFLFLAGVSLVLAHGRGVRVRGFVARLARLVGAAALVTLATYIAFPDFFVFFGVLHGIAASSLIGLAFVRLPAWVSVVAAVAAFGLWIGLSGPIFDAPWLAWLGLRSEFPQTLDYVPVLPWSGNLLAGVAAARWLLGDGRSPRFAWVAAVLKGAPDGAVGRGLAFLGRHALIIYLLHQPLFYGAVWLIALGLE